MQKIFFSIGRLMETTFDWLLTPFGWMPVAAIGSLLFVGMVYWLFLQGKYNQQAASKGTLA